MKTPYKQNKFKFGGIYTIICIDKDGKIKWEDKGHNLVVYQGLESVIDIYFLSGSQLTNWYVGLASSTLTAANTDTLASHAGWSEFSSYTGNRKAYSGVRTNRTISNSASKASFAITGSGTLAGGFLCSVASGTSGTLFSVGAFTGGNRAVVNTDTVNVQYDFTAADDGV